MTSTCARSASSWPAARRRGSGDPRTHEHPPSSAGARLPAAAPPERDTRISGAATARRPTHAQPHRQT
jgi:hypothetical protein